jgi:hypothetical protein
VYVLGLDVGFSMIAPTNAFCLLNVDEVRNEIGLVEQIKWTYPGSVDTFLSRSVLFSQSNLLELSRA